MEKIFVHFIFLTACLTAKSQAVQICASVNVSLTAGQCINLNASSPQFKEFCISKSGTLDQRCCTNGSSLIGLDLGNCSLANFTSFGTVSGLVPSQATHLLMLSLAPGNPDLRCPPPDAFAGLVVLEELLLPSKGVCGNASGGCPTGWQPSASSSGPPPLRCLPPPNACDSVGCPANSSSVCVVTGPGLFECDCESGWSGYRCLRRNANFGYGSFAAGWLASVVAGCLALWLLERRFVGKGPAELGGDSVADGE